MELDVNSIVLKAMKTCIGLPEMSPGTDPPRATLLAPISKVVMTRYHWDWALRLKRLLTCNSGMWNLTGVMILTTRKAGQEMP